MKSTHVVLCLAAIGLGVTIACASEASGPDGSSRRPAVPPEVLAKGRSLYLATCAPCHGERGKGDGPAGKIFKPQPRDHTDPTYMNTISDDEMAKTINMGGALKGKPLMPSNPQIRGEDMKALVAFVRSLSQSDK